MELKPVREQVVVVAGASSGMGRETAIRFARKGAQVVVAARSEPGLTSLVDEIRHSGGEATAVVADVSSFDQVKAIADRAVEQYGRIDTWVHCAAVMIHATLEQTGPEEFKRLIDINLLGQAYGAMAALPHLKRQGGALIHVSSGEGKRALPLQSAYAASKHGIVGLTDALRVELMHEKAPVSVTTILPATINTPFYSKGLSKLGVQAQGSPPVYQPGIVAEAILYAAEHPVREMIVGGAAKVLILGQKVAPGLLDALFARFGFWLQKTNIPRPPDAPNNLFAPIEGYNSARGNLDDQALSTSLYTWLQIHPVARWLVTGAAATLILVVAGSFRNRSV